MIWKVMQNRKSIKINEVAKNGGSAWCLRVKVSHATKVPSVVITPSVVSTNISAHNEKPRRRTRKPIQQVFTAYSTEKNMNKFNFTIVRWMTITHTHTKYNSRTNNERYQKPFYQFSTKFKNKIIIKKHKIRVKVRTYHLLLATCLQTHYSFWSAIHLLKQNTPFWSAWYTDMGAHSDTTKNSF